MSHSLFLPHPSACLPGTFGKGCMQRCSCAQGTSCHHISGECGCPPGFTGNGCEQSELPRTNFFWQITFNATVLPKNYKHCKIKETFLVPQKVKMSLSILFINYYNEPFLLSACLPGTFGQNCNQVCQCSETNQLCHPVSGSCYCAPGYHGPKCAQSMHKQHIHT